MKIDPNKENQERAAQIKEAIASSGMKKSAIAEKLGIKPQAITGWETTGRIHRTMLRELGNVLGRNLSGDEATINDLDDDIKQVVRMMEETDADGRIRARLAVTDAIAQHKRVSGVPDLELAIAGVKDPNIRASLEAALETGKKSTQNADIKLGRKAG